MINFIIPDTVDLDDKEMAMVVSSTLYEKGKLSLGQVAEMAGLTKLTFAELIGKYGVSIFNFPRADLMRDVKMPEVIILDTSCLKILNKIGKPDLLRQLYQTVTNKQSMDRSPDCGQRFRQGTEMKTSAFIHDYRVGG